jgi:hypothetical protein
VCKRWDTLEQSKSHNILYAAKQLEPLAHRHQILRSCSRNSRKILRMRVSKRGAIPLLQRVRSSLSAPRISALMAWRFDALNRPTFPPIFLPQCARCFLSCCAQASALLTPNAVAAQIVRIPRQLTGLDHRDQTRLTYTVNAHQRADLVPKQQSPGLGLRGGNGSASVLVLGPGTTVHLDQRVMSPAEDTLVIFRVRMIAQ